MLAEDHLRAASSELLKAVEVLKAEITQLRNDEAAIKQSVNMQIVQLEQQARMTEQQIHATNDTGSQDNAKRQLNQVQTQISDKRRELDEEIKRITNLVRDKESAINTISQQARDVAPS